MEILINSDNRIKGDESTNAEIEALVEAALERFATRITRVEVHLSDTNGPKHGAQEKRCVMEARIGGLRPIAVADEAATLLIAIEGAAGKLKRAIEHTLGRLDTKALDAPKR